MFARPPQVLRPLVFERVAHVFRVALRLDIEVDRLDVAVAADDERTARDTHVCLAVHTLLDPDAMFLRGRRALIGQEKEGEVVLLLELLQGCDRIGADAHDAVAKSVKIGLQITEGHCFGRSAVGVCLGEIEKDHPPLVAREVRDGMRRAIGADKAEVGQRVSHRRQCVCCLRQ